MIDLAALNARIDLPTVVAHYTPLRKLGNEWVGLCVAHSDKDPSMHVYMKGGKWQVHCFACGFHQDAVGFVQHAEGCDFKAACEILGGREEWSPTIERIPQRPDRVTSKPPHLTAAPDMHIRALGDPSRSWCYKDADGGVLGYVARYDTDDGKEIRCWTWGARGDEPPAWGCGHWNRPRPLYGLDRLAARPEAPVLIVEGEKAADAAAALLPAYAVITWPGGAESYDRADWTPVARRTVLLWPDADKAGVGCMDSLGRLLSTGLGCGVAVLDVSGMPEGSDAADMADSGATTAAVIQWAKPRKRAFALPQPAAVMPEEMPEEGSEPAPVSVVVMRSQDELPDLRVYEDEPTPAALQHDPPPRRRPRLQVVGGFEGAAAPAVEDEPLPLELSESGMADEFAAGNQHDLRYVPEWQKRGWLVWNGSRWKREPRRNTAIHRMRAIAHGLKYRAAAAAMTPAGKAKLESTHYVGNVLDFAESDRRLLATPQQWDADPFLLGVPGGTVDLGTGEMRDCLPEQFITRQTAVAPEEGPTPLFDRVLAQAADGDADMLDYIWRWLGYSLTGDVREESFMFLYGPPACGKTTLIEAVAAILGNAHDGGYAVKAKIELFLDSKGDKEGRFHILHGARFAYCAETEEGRHWKAATIKEATGGDTMVGERKYEEEFSFRPTHKLFIHGNHRPHMRQVDEGLRRRMHIVEYHASVEKSERDVTLKQRLVAEYPAILFRMIRGCLDWQRGSLRAPEPVTRAVDEYFEGEDSFGAWLAECIVTRKGARLSSTGAYNNFRDWCAARGEHAPGHKRFTPMMRSRGIEQIKSGGAMYFRDVELSSAHLPPPPDFDR